MRLTNLFWTFKYPILVFLINQFVFNPLLVYQKLPWFDIPMHLLGGSVVALSGMQLLDEFRKDEKYQGSRFVSFLFVVSFVALIAVAWEWYEWLLSFIFSSSPQNINDTLKDLFFGIMGGMVGAIRIFAEVK